MGEADSRFIAPESPDRSGGNQLVLVGVNGRCARLAITTAIWLVAFASVACASDAPAQSGQNRPGEEGQNAGVTVPDEISGLDSEEVERRLGRLLGEPVGSESDALAAQDVEPTVSPDEPTLEEILDLLSSETATVDTREIVISVSPATISRLTQPVLTIRTPPQFGFATVISSNQILYVPGEGSGNGDSFEYELFDGEKSVIALDVELRR